MTRLAASRRDPSEVTDWLDLDHRDAVDWGRRALGRALTDGALTAAFNGFYFQHLAMTSASGLGAMASYGTRPFHTLTAGRGLSELTDALASGLDVGCERRPSA